MSTYYREEKVMGGGSALIPLNSEVPKPEHSTLESVSLITKLKDQYKKRDSLIIPSPDYKPEYPDLSEAKVLGYDLETYDPHLTDKKGGGGPGVYRQDGFILGAAIADDRGNKNYYNLGHPDITRKERERNIEYIEYSLSLDKPKIGANLPYDLDWTENYDYQKEDEDKRWFMLWRPIKVEGILYDILVAEALLDETNPRINLDNCAKKYLGRGKENEYLIKYCQEMGFKGDVRKHLHKMPSWMVAPYGCGDAEEAVDIFRVQWVKMRETEVLSVFTKIETPLIRPLLHMHKTGLIIDQEKRDRNAFKAQCIYEELLLEIEEKYGSFNVGSSKQIAEKFDSLGIEYERKKETGNPILDAKALKPIAAKHEIADLILQAKKAKTMISNFLTGAFVNGAGKDGRIHTTYKSTKDDQGGTRSGRLAAKDPNLQQVPNPSKDKGKKAKFGHLCRSCFIPEPGHWFVKMDYSQLEYRIIAHFAVGPGANEVRRKYNENPHTDYHKMIMELTGLSRPEAKVVNFGIAFLMGKAKLAKENNWTLKQATQILRTYHTRAPYVKATQKSLEREAYRKGYITTIAGRKAHIKGRESLAMSRKIQGSAADVLKQAILDIWNSWVLTVLQWHENTHDEIGWSMPKTLEGLKAIREAKRLMENAFADDLKVPLIADLELGDSWGDVKEIDIYDERIDESSDEAFRKSIERILEER